MNNRKYPKLYNLMGEYYNYPWNWDFLDLVYEMLQTCADNIQSNPKNYNLAHIVNEEIEKTLILEWQRWEIMKALQTAEQACWTSARIILKHDMIYILQAWIKWRVDLQ